MTIADFRKQMNEWGRDEVPFFFMIDFEMKKPVIARMDQIDSNEILFQINGVSNFIASKAARSVGTDLTNLRPVTLSDYKISFDRVLHHLDYGDSYLTNLTFKTQVESSRSLREIFFNTSAKYKLYYRNEFLVFSPEIFVQIRDGRIHSYPMKGTIDASKPGAREVILRDQKELAEHVTIVDLIRNDLSQVASQVEVTRFRYVEEIRTRNKNLLQVSSEIVGRLADDYKTHLGDIFIKLLPAGSISGAPKSKTLEIIQEAEGEDRGYYTGVMGFFDGKILDSGVMIRFIERANGKYFYRSGAGITTQSVLESEYQETIDKVYVPVD